MSAPASPRWLKLLRAAPLVVGAAHVVLFSIVAVQRFRFPTEIEWMSGSIADQVERVLSGEPLYVPATARYVPYLYPPLHYWLSAAFARVMSIESAIRVASLIPAAMTAWLVHAATRRLSGSRYWSWISVAVYAGAYSLTGFWYDLGRSDPLAIALLMGAFVVTLSAETAAGTAIAGVLFAAAFFAKQPALVYLAAATGALFVARRPRLAGVLVASALAVLVPGALVLQAKTGGWFWFYCMTMPGKHGIDLRFVPVFFIADLSKMFAITTGTAWALYGFTGGAVRSVRDRKSPAAAIGKNEALFGAAIAASLLASATSRLHVGGYLNVLMFLTTFGAVAVGVAGARTSARVASPTFDGALAFGLLLQLGLLLYLPGQAAPNEDRMRDAAVVERRVHALEAHGEVIVHGRGHLTEPRHFHIVALVDILRSGYPIPEDLRRGLVERRYAAYVVDAFYELSLEPILRTRSELWELVVRNYFVSERFDDTEPPPTVGWIAHPTWVFRPRRTPLESASIEDLERRLKIETGIAEMRMREVQAGVRQPDDGDDIERLAAEADRR